MKKLQRRSVGVLRFVQDQLKQNTFFELFVLIIKYKQSTTQWPILYLSRNIFTYLLFMMTKTLLSTI